MFSCHAARMSLVLMVRGLSKCQATWVLAQQLCLPLCCCCSRHGQHRRAPAAESQQGCCWLRASSHGTLLVTLWADIMLEETCIFSLPCTDPKSETPPEQVKESAYTPVIAPTWERGLALRWSSFYLSLFIPQLSLRFFRRQDEILLPHLRGQYIIFALDFQHCNLEQKLDPIFNSSLKRSRKHETAKA